MVLFGSFSVPAQQIARSTREVTIDVPQSLPPWFRSDEALVDGVHDANGRVLIGLKLPSAARSLEAGGARLSIPPGTLGTPISELAELGLPDAELIGDLGIIIGSVRPDVAPRIRANPWVDFIEPNFPAKLGTAGSRPPAPRFRVQSMPWGVAMVNANDVWGVTKGSGASVMIIDTGFDDGHEDLVNVTNSSHCFGDFGGCDDSHPHGTHVLGDLMARNNSLGYVGVAPAVQPADVYSWAACDDSTGECDLSEVVQGIYKADSLNIDVLNMSLYYLTYSSSVATAVNAALSSGVFVVAIAGNNTGSTLVYPAGHTYVVGVSGVDSDKSFADSSPCGASSGYGSTHVDVAAPYWSINAEPGDTYAQNCGTSFSAPHVAGIAALLKAKWPSLDNFAIRDRIRGTATDLGASGYDQYFGHGLVNAFTAFGPWPSIIQGEVFVEPGQVCSWKGTATGGTAVSPRSGT